MAETYPIDVPYLVVTGSLISSPIDTVLRSEVDIGKAMTRLKYTGELFNTTFRIQMNRTQLNSLINWYHYTLNKVLKFNFPVPLSGGVLREYSFITPPKSVHIGREEYIVSYDLRSVIGYIDILANVITEPLTGNIITEPLTGNYITEP